MPRSAGRPSAALIDRMLGEASWLLSHAQALTDYGRGEEAAAELARAAACEEQVACLLDASGQGREAALHRASAASCYERLGEFVRAVTALRGALSGPLDNDYRVRLEQQLARSLAQACREVDRLSRRKARKRTPAVP